jgi:hypothetical protein
MFEGAAWRPLAAADDDTTTGTLEACLRTNPKSTEHVYATLGRSVQFLQIAANALFQLLKLPLNLALGKSLICRERLLR